MIGFQNEWRGVGRLTADVDLRQTTSGIAVCNFTVAVDRTGTNKDNKITDFFDCTAWRQTAETICRYFKQGDPLGIIGSLQNDRYTDKDGNNRTKTEISVDQIFFLPRRKPREQGEETAPAADANGFIPTETDELPF